MARTGILLVAVLGFKRALEIGPGVLQIAVRPPEVASDLLPPLPDISLAVLAHRKDHVPRNLVERGAHDGVGLLQGFHRRIRSRKRFIRAPIILEEIDSPGRVGSRVLILVLITAFIPGASLRTGGGINAELQAPGVEIIGQPLHVREFFVGLDMARVVPFPLPPIVEADVLVPVLGKLLGNKGIRHPLDSLVIHLPAKRIPRIPSHRRR